MNINFVIISGVLLIYHTFVMPKLKLPVTISCPLFSEQRTKLPENLSNLDDKLINRCDDGIVNILLYGSSKYNFSTNNKILSLSVEFLECTKRFDKPLF